MLEAMWEPPHFTTINNTEVIPANANTPALANEISPVAHAVSRGGTISSTTIDNAKSPINSFRGASCRILLKITNPIDAMALAPIAHRRLTPEILPQLLIENGAAIAKQTNDTTTVVARASRPLLSIMRGHAPQQNPVTIANIRSIAPSCFDGYVMDLVANFSYVSPKVKKTRSGLPW